MRLIRKEKETKMMTDSDDQYGKSTSSNMLMDCIQFAVVIRANTHADTSRDRKPSLGCRDRRQDTFVPAHYGARLAEDRKQEKRTG